MKRAFFIVIGLFLLLTATVHAQSVDTLTVTVPAGIIGTAVEAPALPQDCGVQLIDYAWDTKDTVFGDKTYTLSLTVETEYGYTFDDSFSPDLGEQYTLVSQRLGDTRCVATYAMVPQPAVEASVALPILSPGKSVAEALGDFIFSCPNRKTVLFLVYEDNVLLGYGGGDGVFSADARVRAGHTYKFLGTVTLDRGYVSGVRITNPQEAVSLSTLADYKAFSLQAELLCPMTARELFRDVKFGDWYYAGVDYCFRTGRMNGMGGGYFLPNGKCTRAQLAVMVYRLWGNGMQGDLSRFPDAPAVQSWAKAAMTWAVGYDIVQGIGGKLLPNATVTRGQCATIFMRIKELT